MKALMIILATSVVASTLVALITGGAGLSGFSDLGSPENPIDMAVFVWDIVTATLGFLANAVTWGFLIDAGVDGTFVAVLQTITGAILAWNIIERFW